MGFHSKLDPLASTDVEYCGPAIKSIQKRRTREHINRAYETLKDRVGNKSLKVDVRFSRRGRMRARAEVKLPLPERSPLGDTHKAAFIVTFVDQQREKMVVYGSQEDVGSFGQEMVAD